MLVTVTADVPAARPGREWLATALLEAPDRDGKPGDWTAIEAAEGPLSEMQTRHAVHADGWYRLQWYDDGKVSKFSTPVRRDGETPGRVVGGLRVT